LSDLGGTDVYVHGGKPLGIFRELCSAFVRAQHQPTVEEMNIVYQIFIEESVAKIDAEREKPDGVPSTSVFRFVHFGPRLKRTTKPGRTLTRMRRQVLPNVQRG
jgi:hypothetical protein